jgi:hypothetical protein
LFTDLIFRGTALSIFGDLFSGKGYVHR